MLDPLLAYAQSHTQKPSDLLLDLEAFTLNHIHGGKMASGAYQGRLLSFLSCLKKPQSILEIGTFMGYSALCLAEGLQEKGRLITISKEKNLQDLVKGYWEKAGYLDKIQLLIGDAKDILPTLEGSFDLVFIDADKKAYLHYYEMVLPLLAKRGLIIVDNVLWKGKVLEEAVDEKTAAIQHFNAFVASDPRVKALFLPLLDGFLLLEKV